MAIEVKLPPAEGVESADIAEVYVSEGDVIARDQSICQIETGKATLDVPSTHAGRVTKVHIKAGQSIPVGGLLLTLEAVAGAATPAAAPPASKPAAAPPAPAVSQPQPVAAPPAPSPAPAKSPSVASPAPVAPSPAASRSVEPAPAMTFASPASVATESVSDDSLVPAGPAVRRFAREVGVDLRSVTGSGDGGRITRDDVLRVVREHSQGAAVASAQTKTAKKGSTGVSDNWGPVHIERLTKIRKTIAQQMHKSWSTVPRVTNFDDADVTELEKLRQASKDDYAKKGIKLTSLPFLVKAVAMALRDHPAINASIDMEQEQIIYKQYVNVGIAVDSDRGLVVPSIRNVDELSIPDVARSIAQLVENVRNNNFTLADLQGSTFTISNLGAIGGTYSTPIINVPEVAILLVGRSRQMPVVIDDQICVRLMMPMSLSYDHRLVDGATAARFLNEVMGYLKNPGRLLLAP